MQVAIDTGRPRKILGSLGWKRISKKKIKRSKKVQFVEKETTD